MARVIRRCAASYGRFIELPQRQATRLALLVLGSFTVGCLPPLTSVRLSSPTRIAVAVVHNDAYGRLATTVPAAFSRKLTAELRRHNLVPELLRPQTYLPVFARAHDSEHRLTNLARLAKRAPLILLVETEAQPQPRANGSTTWCVFVKLSLADTTNPRLPTIEEAEVVPTHRAHHPTTARAALAIASHGVSHNLERLLNTFLGNRHDAAVTRRSALGLAALSRSDSQTRLTSVGDQAPR